MRIYGRGRSSFLCEIWKKQFGAQENFPGALLTYSLVAFTPSFQARSCYTVGKWGHRLSIQKNSATERETNPEMVRTHLQASGSFDNHTALRSLINLKEGPPRTG